MAYEVEITRAARHALERLHGPLADRLHHAIERLADERRHQGVVALKGALAGDYRVRVGDHRIVFEIDDARRVVQVVEVGHRGSVYPRRRRA